MGRLLLGEGASAKAVAKDGWTVLHWTVRRRCPGCWSQGAGPCSERPPPPLGRAQALNTTGAVGSEDFAELLLQKGARCDAVNKEYQRPIDVVGLAPGSRSKRQQAADDDMRALLDAAEEEEEAD